MSGTFINPQRKVLAHLDRLGAWQYGLKPAPVTVEWDLSNRCYLGCQSCHFAHTHSRGPWASRSRRLPMAFEQTGDLADLAMVRRGLGEMAKAGVQGVIWAGGGEPTTHPGWLEAVQAASTAGLEQGTYTAGGLLSQAQAAELKRLASFVVVSLDAWNRETYLAEKAVDGFQRATDGLRWLAEADGQAVIGASFLLHAGNWFDAFEMLLLARRLGATYTTFRPTIEASPDHPAKCASDRGWITTAMPVLQALTSEPDVEIDPARFRAYRDWNERSYAVCRGIQLVATVTPDGRVWICLQRRGIDGSSLGDLRQESFDTIWARHPGQWTDFRDCRVMCRLHSLNEQINEVMAPRAQQHAAFV